MTPLSASLANRGIRCRRAAGFLLSMAAAASSSFAQTPAIGAGASACSGYLTARAKEARTGNISDSFVHVSWAQGYLSGLSFARSVQDLKPLPLPEFATLGFMLDQHCRDLPAEPFYVSVLEVWKEVLRKQAGQKSP